MQGMRLTTRGIVVLCAIGGLILFMIIAIGSCGGDDSPEVPITIPTEASTTGSLEKDEFIAEADAICAEANAAIDQYAEAGEGLTAAGEIADLRQSVVTDIEALGPPADDRATLDEFLVAMETQVEAGEKIALALDRGSDTAEFEAELATAKTDAATAASAYGFEECGAEVTASSSATGGSTSSGGTVAPAPVTPAPAPTDDGGVTDDGTSGTGGGVSPDGGVEP